MHACARGIPMWCCARVEKQSTQAHLACECVHLNESRTSTTMSTLDWVVANVWRFVIDWMRKRNFSKCRIDVKSELHELQKKGEREGGIWNEITGYDRSIKKEIACNYDRMTFGKKKLLKISWNTLIDSLISFLCDPLTCWHYGNRFCFVFLVFLWHTMRCWQS